MKTADVLAILLIAAGGTIAAAGARATAQEKITLSAPVYVSAGVTEFRVESLYLKRSHPDSEAEIRALFREVSPTTFVFVPNGKTLTCRYDGAAADTLIVQLNKTNLAIASLEKRVTQRCQTDGKLGAGTIVGSPE